MFVLLIIVWFTQILDNKVSIKALFLNRVGDLGLTLGILTIYLKLDTVKYATFFTMAPFFSK